MNDPYHLSRFLEAQDAVYDSVLEELAFGRKKGHWMWFVFPQIKGLGHSPIAQHYAIASLDEARDYLEHPVLGQRLVECAQRVLDLQDRSITSIFGFPDNLKYRSCMTLFREVGKRPGIFQRALDAHFGGEPDSLTLRLLGKSEDTAE